MLCTCAYVHVAYVRLCSCCVPALMFMLRARACNQVAYVRLCPCLPFVRLCSCYACALGFMLRTCACVYAAYLRLCPMFRTCVCVHVAYVRHLYYRFPPICDVKVKVHLCDTRLIIICIFYDITDHDHLDNILVIPHMTN